jgi:hypothetical protein
VVLQVWPRNQVTVVSDEKSLLIDSFDTRRVVHHEFLPQGQTVSQHYYIDTL